MDLPLLVDDKEFKLEAVRLVLEWKALNVREYKRKIIRKHKICAFNIGYDLLKRFW